MRSESISQETKCVLGKIAKSDIAKNFYLAGGTALAIQLGHRQSIDLDWFSKSPFSNSDLKKELASLGNFRLDNEAVGTINGLLDGVRVSFFYYDYGLLFPFILFEGVNLADERDIAAMKIDAISSRGSKKDFVDVYFLLEKYQLPELVSFFEKKYSGIKYNKLHILKSLIYFNDAEDEPMPRMFKRIEWRKIKEKIKETVLV